MARCDKWENNSSDGVRLYGGATVEGEGVWGGRPLVFPPALMKSLEAVTLDVRGYRSFNPDVTALPNSSSPTAKRSRWVTLFVLQQQ